MSELEVLARPRPSELALARFGLFLQGKIVFAWIATCGAFFVGWLVARARGSPVPAHLALPLLLVLVCAPLLFVFFGIGSKRARAATKEGVRMKLDAEGIVVAGERRAWSSLDDVFEIGTVFVVIDRGTLHVVPRRAFETMERLRAFRSFVASRRRAG